VKERVCGGAAEEQRGDGRDEVEVGDEFTRTGIPGPLIGRLFLRASVWLEAAILLFFPLV